MCSPQKYSTECEHIHGDAAGKPLSDCLFVCAFASTRLVNMLCCHTFQGVSMNHIDMGLFFECYLIEIVF